MRWTRCALGMALFALALGTLTLLRRPHPDNSGTTPGLTSTPAAPTEQQAVPDSAPHGGPVAPALAATPQSVTPPSPTRAVSMDSQPLIRLGGPLPSAAYLATRQSAAQPASQADANSLTRSSLPSAEQASLGRALSEARRAIRPIAATQADKPQNRGAHFFAFNPGQNLTARFLSSTVRIESGRADSDWKASFSLGNDRDVSEIVADGTRLEYRHTGLIEWYENRIDGIEHGMILLQRPGTGSEARLPVTVQGLSVRRSETTPGSLELTTPAGAPVLAYEKVRVWDSTDRELPARLEPTAQGLAIVVTDAGARYPLVVDPVIVSLEQKFSPEVTGDGAANEKFGWSVDICGDTALIGAHFDATAAGTRAGSAYVFVRDGAGNWSRQAKLEVAITAANDQFGNAVSLDGDTAVVGAWLVDDPISGTDSGAAYVFLRSNGAWQEQGKLYMEMPGSVYAYFGAAVSVKGNTAMIGAMRAGTGKVHEFRRNNGAWNYWNTISGSTPEGWFGSSVSLDGNTVAIGAKLENTYDGAVYVYTLTAGNWTQKANLKLPDPDIKGKYAFFGGSVSLSGDRLVAGAGVASVTGRVYVYFFNGVTWNLEARVIPDNSFKGDLFGCFADIDGDTLTATGSIMNPDKKSAVFMFTRANNKWTQQAAMQADGVTLQRDCGTAVALDADSVLAGAPEAATGAGISAGAAYVFTRDGMGVWSQQVRLSAGTTSANDLFGNSVSVQGDTAVIGTPYDSTEAGAKVGSAQVFTRTGAAWSLQSTLMAADAEASDYFGCSVSLHNDTVLIGAYGDNASTSSDVAGSAYVFTRSAGQWSQQARIIPAARDRMTGAFGYAVSLFGDTALIGAYGTTRYTGRAFFFQRTNGAWTEQQSFSGGALNDSFGKSVALYGDSAAIGAPGNGSVYAYKRNGGAWSQQAQLTAVSALGASVGLYGNTLLAGAPAAGLAGAVHVYVFDGAQWSQQSVLEPAAGAYDEGFGTAVAVGLNTALIGAISGISTGGIDTGSAYVFTRDATVWRQAAKFEAFDGASGDQFGSAVSLDGNTALVGAKQDDGADFTGASITNMGGAYVYRLNLPPVAVAGGPYFANPNLPLSLDGSGSYDPEAATGGRIVAYEWDLTDDGAYDYNGVSPVIPYNELVAVGGGTGVLIQARLRVTDDQGLTASDPFVWTLNRAPIADAGGPYSAAEGQSINLNASASSDPDAAAGDRIVAYEWDLDNDGQYDDAVGAAPTCSMPDNGIHTLGLRATDTAGLTSTATATFTASNANPRVEAGPDRTVSVAATLSLAPATFTDPGSADTHTASIDWGDTHTTAGAVNEGAGTISGTHVYSAVGVYTLTVTVQDDDGGSASDTLQVTVTAATEPPPPPVITAFRLTASEVQVSWRCVSGGLYRLLRAAAATGPYTVISGQDPIQPTELEAQAGVMSFTDPNAVPAEKVFFYKVRRL